MWGEGVSVVVLPCHTQGGFHQRSTALSASIRSLCKLLSVANSPSGQPSPMAGQPPRGWPCGATTAVESGDLILRMSAL